MIESESDFSDPEIEEFRNLRLRGRPQGYKNSICAIQISLNRKSLVDAKIPRSRQVLTLAAQSKESVTKIEPLYAIDSTVLFMRISVLLERSGNEIENYFRYELMPEPTSLFKENFMRTK
ncbi:hypothetical protein GQR58_007176 [Nymphon striatum]|nr:hypothetical protein GQR58_007176 [Nymphon striatum]